MAGTSRLSIKEQHPLTMIHGIRWEEEGSQLTVAVFQSAGKVTNKNVQAETTHLGFFFTLLLL